MKSLLLFLGAVLLLPVCAGSVELLTDQKNPDVWKGMVKYVPGAERGKGACFELYGRYPTPLKCSRMIPISENKLYTLKVSWRNADDKLPASAYLGLELYDKEKRLLVFRNIQFFNGSDSKVISAKKGSRSLTVEKFPAFQKVKKAVVAFGAKKDLSDIPNFDLSSQITGMRADDKGNVIIDLSSPLTRDYPAGTAIRLHAPWAAPMYYLASGWVPAGDGVEKVVKLQGVSRVPGTARTTPLKFWKGTCYVRPFVWFGNWNRKPKAGAKLLVDGFSFTEEDLPAAKNVK